MPAKRGAWLAVALVAIAAAFWYRSHVLSEPPLSEVHIAFVTGGSNSYWQLTANGARAAAHDNRVDLRVVMPEENENVEQQTALLSDLDLKGVEGVAVSPLDAEGQTATIDKLAKGVVVVTFDSDAPDSQRVRYVGASNFQAGRRAASLVHEAIPAGGKVAVVVVNLTKDNMIERRAGFDDAIAKNAGEQPTEAPSAAYEVVDYIVDEGNADVCRERVKKSLVDHPDIACLVGMNAYHGPILLKVLDDEQKLGKVAIVAFDEQDETLAGIEAGTIYATVAQDPYLFGYEAVRSLAVMCRGGDRQRPIAGAESTLSVTTTSVTKDNLPEFRKQLAERLKATGDAAGKSTP